jgi:hypothetical protein
MLNDRERALLGRVSGRILFVAATALAIKDPTARLCSDAAASDTVKATKFLETSVLPVLKKAQAVLPSIQCA